MISKDQALLICQGYWSVNTWSDPGVALYALGSTGCIQSEEHRTNILSYLKDGCVRAASLCDAVGDSAIVMDTNVEDIEALVEYVEASPIEAIAA